MQTTVIEQQLKNKIKTTIKKKRNGGTEKVDFLTPPFFPISHLKVF